MKELYMVDIQIIYWCDIFVQILCGCGCKVVKQFLFEWFEQVIDCVVMKGGVGDIDVYLVEWCCSDFYIVDGSDVDVVVVEVVCFDVEYD